MRGWWREVRSLTAVLGAVLLLAAAGCGPGEEEAEDDLRALSERMIEEGRQVVGTLTDAGLPVAEAAGRGETCRMEPAPGATFRVSGTLTEQAPYEEQYEAARAALEAEGWEVASTGVHQGESWANLTREGYLLDLGHTSRQGSEALVFGLVREEDACVDVPDGSFRIPDDLQEVPLTSA